MEQRPLRLGDIVDDYCTRERRITNHAIVAVVDNTIRQTRCTTCDTEHPYKGAKEPRLRKKPQTTELYERVLADVAGTAPSTAPSSEPVEAAAKADPVDAAMAEVTTPPEGAPVDLAPPADDGWLAHRRLIRATLPRTDDEPAPRPIPEFTMHQRPQSRGNRQFQFRGNGNANGNANGNGPQPRQGVGQGRPGQPSGRPGRHRRRKRPR